MNRFVSDDRSEGTTSNRLPIQPTRDTGSLKTDQSFIAALLDAPEGVVMVQLAQFRRLHGKDTQGYGDSRIFDAETISMFSTEWASDGTPELHAMSSAVTVEWLPLPSTVGAPT